MKSKIMLCSDSKSSINSFCLLISRNNTNNLYSNLARTNKVLLGLADLDK